LTPESSERPRETRDGMPLVERFDAAAALHVPVMAEEPLTRSTQLKGEFKVSSPELASLAAKYVNIDTVELMDLDRTAAFELCMDVRSLAASVLAQAEGNPHK
jgi:hypothetical protein